MILFNEKVLFFSDLVSFLIHDDYDDDDDMSDFEVLSIMYSI